jgi:hypothetical protein
MVMQSADYSFVDRLLHRLALGNRIVPELAFDLERSTYAARISPCDAISVLGLARSGSTALMRALHSTGRFASLTYYDMPFVMAPNLWHSIARHGKRSRLIGERAHGDGILVDFDSPEAFEEVFWRTVAGADYIAPDHLRVHCVPSELLAKRSTLQSLVCLRYGAKRYLAKNNNQLLRLASLAPQTPQETYLIIFRDPMAQARSLLAQHLRFAEVDGFTQRYMEWLVHHEFGATHRPFAFSGELPVTGSPSALDYWLQRWIDAYGYLLQLLRARHSDNLIVVEYESLCVDSKYRRRLFDRVGSKESEYALRTIVGNHDRMRAEMDPSVTKRAYAIKDELATIARSV